MPIKTKPIVRCVNDYYEYILSILKYIIDKNNLSINIILNGGEYNFRNNNKTIKVAINYEHTLVKEGGRSVQKGTPFGKIKYNVNNSEHSFNEGDKVPSLVSDVMSATYGDHDNGVTVDVTSVVQQQANEGYNWQVNNDIMGGDPCPGIRKSLRIRISCTQNKNYLVRIYRFQHLNSSDIIIDYSNPNIVNVKQCGMFSNFSNKHIYVAPTLYENLYINTDNRNIQSLTTFIDINEPKRKKLLENISKSNLSHSNINNCFDKTKLEEIFQNTKVLINIHQTPHHDTFEELRCLPALQNGIIVVSENSPLNHLIPYNNLIIWTDYENIINKTKEVLENYKAYHKKIFRKENLDILNSMHNENKRCLEDKIMKIVEK